MIATALTGVGVVIAVWRIVDRKVDNVRRDLMAEIRAVHARIDGMNARIDGVNTRIDTVLLTAGRPQ